MTLAKRPVLWLLPLALIQGCTGATQTSEFLVLTAPPPAPFSSQTPSGLTALSVGLGPIRIPDTLDRPQMLTRLGSNRVALSEYHRWAGALEANIYRVLEQHLMDRLNSDKVAPYPWPRYRKLDYQISIEILQFIGAPGGQVELSGVWSLLDGEGKAEHHIQRFSIKEPVNGDSMAEVAAAQSRALGYLGDELANALFARESPHAK